MLYSNKFTFKISVSGNWQKSRSMLCKRLFCGLPPRPKRAKAPSPNDLMAMAPQNPITASPEWQPGANPWLIASAVMLATLMEVLDTSVANVSLAHIAGNLDVSYNEATWVLTNYLVSNGVVLPTTGWVARYFGRKRLH